ncbi:MAG TPA: hypothetical protein PKY77_25280 [Phycisphaerae bacterium]|nr:hypothetical protein [Phycisphaerae bacterium]HRY71569.1 hypothetical protein [Phycisphaerae bacterium]HSA29936.1 hypothetical protein [Phycisphaerae bacterium]
MTNPLLEEARKAGQDYIAAQGVDAAQVDATSLGRALPDGP